MVAIVALSICARKHANDQRFSQKNTSTRVVKDDARADQKHNTFFFGLSQCTIEIRSEPGGGGFLRSRISNISILLATSKLPFTIAS